MAGSQDRIVITVLDETEEVAGVTTRGETITVPLGTYTDTITMDDCNPLENGSKDRKYYVRDIGLAIDEDEELTSFSNP